MSTIVCKFFDQVLVGIAQFIIFYAAQIEFVLREMLDQVNERSIRKSVFVGPAGIAKNSVERIGIGFFYFTHCILNGHAYIGSGFSGGVPMRFLWHYKMVVLCKCGIFHIAITLFQSFFKFFVI